MPPTPRNDPDSLFAITAPGFEPLCARELRELGVTDARAETGGVSFSGDSAVLSRVNLGSRIASRVIVRVAEFEARAFHELERLARQVPWDRYLDRGATVRLRVTCRKSRLYHSDAVAQRVADAIVRKTGAVVTTAGAGGTEEGSDGDAAGAGQLFIVRFLHDVCTISADSSGELLHRRGYRKAVAKAPLRETLAAGTLRASGWRTDAPLIDPLCGSGTIPIEAALMARDISPGMNASGEIVRDYAFLHWPGHDASAWLATVEAARARIRPSAPAAIVGADRDEGAIIAARANALRAGVAEDIELVQRPVSGLEIPAGEPGWIVSNPPYGERVGRSGDLRDLYAALGNTLRARAPGWTLALLTADMALARETKLPLREALASSNGGIPVRLFVASVPG